MRSSGSVASPKNPCVLGVSDLLPPHSNFVCDAQGVWFYMHVCVSVIFVRCERQAGV